ncbi:MAG: hypothetical protein JW719_09195 [Pirellulales bacterium]|nr:hypothetical protein [Pirellulales bacterium]
MMVDPTQWPVDWHRIERERRRAPTAVDSRVRLRACWILFLVFLAVVFGRVVHLEMTQGTAFRRAAAEPFVAESRVPTTRGRIVSRDGAVLARDEQVSCLAVDYRYLEDPPDAAWLRALARRRLPRDQRRDFQRLVEEENRIHREHRRAQRRLAELCGLSFAQWNRRAAELQARVERIAQSVNRRQQEEYERRRRAEPPNQTFFDRWFGTTEEKPPERIVIREQRDYHVMAEDVPAEAVAQIENHPDRYPGVRFVRRTRRTYPAGSLAAHVVGYLGLIAREETGTDQRGTLVPGERGGRDGVERQYDVRLHGRPGRLVEKTNREGRVVSSEWLARPRPGGDVVLTLDARLQQTAETLLDDALARRKLTGAKPELAGGAVLVMDVASGAILAAASAPRFDPNGFSRETSNQAAAVLGDPAKPLFHRAIQMAIAPGSLWKVLSAVALVESGRVDPRESFYCRGYLERPDELRCQIYRRHERGHGEVTLADALAVSCNVYFFHHAGLSGPGPIIDWARRFELDRTTGIDLSGEAAGRVPTPETLPALERHAWRIGDTRRLAVGQGSVTMTPLGAARLMAAVANGGRLVAPHVVRWANAPGPRPIAGLHPATLATIGRGLRMAVESTRGTAYPTVFNESVAVAGKTGTAETGDDRSDHAWFAGYAPADRPRVAMVVVLAHSGDGGEAAGPVAQRLVLRMKRLGLLDEP